MVADGTEVDRVRTHTEVALVSPPSLTGEGVCKEWVAINKSCELTTRAVIINHQGEHYRQHSTHSTHSSASAMQTPTLREPMEVIPH